MRLIRCDRCKAEVQDGAHKKILLVSNPRGGNACEDSYDLCAKCYNEAAKWAEGRDLDEAD